MLRIYLISANYFQELVVYQIEIIIIPRNEKE